MSITYSDKAIEYSNKSVNMGRMNDPTGAAWIKGLCGDTMEMYLIIENEMIKEAKYYTDGCLATRACGSAVTELIQNKNVDEALSISAKDVITKLNGLPEENLHCSILAVSTLYKALANYLLMY